MHSDSPRHDQEKSKWAMMEIKQQTLNERLNMGTAIF
jgi:hypothetical protein